ncbi:ABC transporter permease [Vitreoscilla massiliensis]|uniref:ABC transporter permease n=1 Tax=Vitreoscilla massiliensis TaxID=1689272 RepID=A0ABY4E262_9NEIS|nr:ABC transporter permease [Vitreoscilla massiliensis]UOO89329.1 ABC transporter permease [Vitreoscilla massiliensis]
MMQSLWNIYRLGVKELWSLWRDPVMLVLIVFSFTFSVYSSSKAVPETLTRAPIAIVDEDQSQLSNKIAAAFYPPHFTEAQMVSYQDIDRGMDEGLYTFALIIPHGLQADVVAGKQTSLQLNIDATRMSQAFTGNGAIQQIINAEVNEFSQRYRGNNALPVGLALRARFNPTLDSTWLNSIMQVVNNVTMLSIILTGAALIREREHGTVEHLLVMPVTVFEIMTAKVWSMSLVVLIAAFVSLQAVVRWALEVPIAGSLTLFFAGAVLMLFATTSMGIFMATVAKSMPQFGLLLMMVLLPMEMLSGGQTPRESMPEMVQHLMLAAPTTHFIKLAQAILFRGAGFEVVWPSFLGLFIIGSVFFYLALKRFKNTIHTMA